MKTNQKKSATKLMALILTLLMVLSIATTAIFMIIDTVKANNAEKEKQTTTTPGNDTHDDHDHDHDDHGINENLPPEDTADDIF